MTRRPQWRASLRTAVAALVALIPILPEIIRASGWESIPWIASIAGIAAAITRIMTIPAVDRWIDDYIPWMSEHPYKGKHRKEDHEYRDHDGPGAGRGSY